MGSPPRVRGKVFLQSFPFPHIRITPACAGKRYLRPPAPILIQDHPRVCGEKTAQIAEILNLPGSPPRVRGKVCTHLWTVERDRITPACAGKSSRHPVLLLQPEDHPRVCGEKYNFINRNPPKHGSPPRVRGKDWKSFSVFLHDRITPACAGKRVCIPMRSCGRGDHPRVCGEKLIFSLSHLLKQGSPPRVRGKEVTSRQNFVWIRITPACAGKRERAAPRRQEG